MISHTTRPSSAIPACGGCIYTDTLVPEKVTETSASAADGAHPSRVFRGTNGKNRMCVPGKGYHIDVQETHFVDSHGQQTSAGEGVSTRPDRQNRTPCRGECKNTWGYDTHVSQEVFDSLPDDIKQERGL